MERKERSDIWAVQMDNQNGQSVPNARKRELCEVTKGMDESVLRWFGHIERKGNDMTANRVYVNEYMGNSLVGRPRKRRTDSLNDFKRKREV